MRWDLELFNGGNVELNILDSPISVLGFGFDYYWYF